jgi:hypothetical protein
MATSKDFEKLWKRYQPTSVKSTKDSKKAAYMLIFSRFFHIFAVETQNDCI